MPYIFFTGSNNKAKQELSDIMDNRSLSKPACIDIAVQGNMACSLN